MSVPPSSSVLRSRFALGGSRATRFAPWLGLMLLVAVSAGVRTRELGVGLWVDEALSIGIADHRLAEIPAVLRQDASPPLYYLLLHGWMAVAGRSEAATHALSVLFAVLAVPAALWAARGPLGDRAGWFAAVLAAVHPFLTAYAQETRMYALLAALGFVATGSWIRTFATPTRNMRARRLPALGFSLSLAAMLYTHNWALFFGAGTALAWGVLLVAGSQDERRRLRRTGLMSYGLALVLYLPWVPSLLYQARHTGAPWATAPTLDALLDVPAQLLGEVTWPALLLVCGIALLRPLPGRVALTALAVMAVATIALPWLTSQLSPTWAARYLIVGLAPSLLLCAAVLASAPRPAPTALVAIAIIWTATLAPSQKSNVREVARAINPVLRAGDLVISTRPGEIPVVHYYLAQNLRYATLTGPVHDVGVPDWRDLMPRLRRTSPEHDLQPLLDDLPAGRRIVLIEPIIYDPSRWNAPSTALIRQRSQQWHHRLSQDPTMHVIASAPQTSDPRSPNPIRATVYLKTPTEHAMHRGVAPLSSSFWKFEPELRGSRVPVLNRRSHPPKRPMATNTKRWISERRDKPAWRRR
jgi:mannosyltransferase